jgi:diguanylate cyclase (GGDEF)-like protein/PAS domain S-box-containing protein
MNKALRILAVDDSRSFLAVTTEMLQGDGHQVISAASGEEAIAIFRREKPDLVIMDRIMPGMGGIEAIRELRKIQGTTWVPIILVTSTMDDGDILEAFSAGADEFLLKPINSLHLHIRLHSVARISAIQHSTMAVIDTLLDGVVRIDGAARVSMFNKAAERIFGYAASEVLGRNVNMLMPSPDREQHDNYIGNYHATGEAKIIGKGRRVIGLRKDGSTFPMHLGITEANTPDGRYFIGLVRDLSREEELLEQVRLLATTDTLTGLPNRRRCEEHLIARYAVRGKPAQCTLFYCDLDGFKAVNDRAGHAAGDAVLIEAAKRIRNEVFVRDFVGRLGGDEFVIIVDGSLSDADAHILGERIVRSANQEIASADGALQIGASVGFAHARDYPGSSEALMNAADKAMYAAKRAGKGRVMGSAS